MEYRKIKGTNDYLPEQSDVFRTIRNRIESIIEHFGFKYEITPILEPYELFQRSIGETTDIIKKEMFVFESKSGKKIALKPEETAVLFRSISEASFLSDNTVKKLFYFTPVFRHERPQKGRFREFYQFGAEVINSHAPSRDAELMKLGNDILKEFHIEGVELHINSIGCPSCRPRYRDELKSFLKSKEQELCEHCRERIETNPLRTLDCKNEKCIAAVNDAPHSTDYLCDDCLNHYNSVKDHLDELSLNFIENPNIVRGLDYYSKTVFEFIEQGDKLGAQSTIIGGGRYDYLGEEFGMNGIGAVGFAGGFERLLMSIPESYIKQIKNANNLDIVAVFFDEPSRKYVMNICSELQKMGIKTDIAFEYNSIKKQLSYASKSGAHYAMICGEDEMNNNTVIMKEMESGNQKEIQANPDTIKGVLNDNSR